MKRLLKIFSLIAAGSLITTALLGYLFVTGKINQSKLLYKMKYHPWITASNPVETIKPVGTNTLKLKLHSYSLASMATKVPFISGGGAILALPDKAVLVLNKNGDLYRFRRNGSGPVLETLGNAVKTNNGIYGDYARSQGYSVRPGTNVGYAGLGMRAIDLLHLKKAGLLAVSYTQWQPARHCALAKVSVRRIDAALAFTPGSVWKEIFQTTTCVGLSQRKAKPFAGHQSASRMYELPDGRFLISTGDFKHDGANRPNILDDQGVDLGKFFIVDPLTGKRELFSSGHRNPQGIIMARDGAFWATEHGPSGGDELNLLVRGKDYGWPNVTMGRLCMSCDHVINGRHDGYEPPVYAWTPSIGISNLIQISGMANDWDGDLLVASLAGQTLFKVKLQNNHANMVQPIFIGERIRDLYQDQNEDIVLWTDTGKIIYLTVDRQLSDVEQRIAALSTEGRDVIEGCKECHVFEKGIRREGKINLWAIMGRGVAATDYPAYSDAMISYGGKWTEERLHEFLRDPQGAIPDSAMASEGILNQKTRNEIIGFLNNLR